jgi:cystathionine beta-lyase/cystathionine gamma-synthase
MAPNLLGNNEFINELRNEMTRTDLQEPMLGLATRAVHAGQVDDPLAGAIMPPIYQTSTYRQQGLGRHRGYEYGRTRNPTREALERNVASLESARHGFAFASGLAALDAVLKLLRAGDHVVAGANLYGGSQRLMVRVYEAFGLQVSFVDTRDPEAIAQAIGPATRLVFCETPTNPMMFLTDLAAVGDISQARGVLLAVDNTFASPVFQRPLELGADIVLHSTTKYLNGHSDMVGGLVVTNRDDVAERLGFLQNASGAVPGPMDCWLALRGVKTLPLRMRQHDASGREIAAWLTRQPAVQRVYYPGLESHPQHALARRQMSGFGGMISFDVGEPDRARRMLERTRIFALAESLGGVESLIGHPASQTHASVPAAARADMGLTDSLIRLSVGIEDVRDLIADLEQALC